MMVPLRAPLTIMLGGGGGGGGGGGVSPVPLASFTYDRQNKTARHSEQQGGGGIGCLVTPLWILIVDRKN